MQSPRPASTPTDSFNIVEAIANTNPAHLKQILDRLNPAAKIKPGFVEKQDPETLAGTHWQRSYHPEVNDPTKFSFDAKISGNAGVLWLFDDIFEQMRPEDDIEVILQDEGNGEFSLIYEVEAVIVVKSTTMVLCSDPNAPNMIMIQDIYVGEPIQPSKRSIVDRDELQDKKDGDKISGKLMFELGWDYVAIKYVTK